MLAVVKETHGGVRESLAQAIHFTGFSAGIQAAVEKERRDSEPAQPAIVEILVRPLYLVSDPEPNAAVALQHCGPVIFSVVLGQQVLRFLAKILWMRSESLEEWA